MWTKTLILGMVTLMGIKGCGDSLPDLADGIFVLKENESYETDGFTLQLNTIQDSRCPKGVKCVWAGNAQAIVAVKSAMPDTLKLCSGSCSPKVGGQPYWGADSDTIYQDNRKWLLTLMEVNPYPIYQKKQAEKEAKFKLEEVK